MKEFSTLHENREQFYTLEPAHGGVRLLLWEHVEYDSVDMLHEDEMMYDEVASGDLEHVLQRLSRLVPEANIEEIRELWDEADAAGDSVVIEGETLRIRGGSQLWEN
jgi:hypothetical protein